MVWLLRRNFHTAPARPVHGGITFAISIAAVCIRALNPPRRETALTGHRRAKLFKKHCLSVLTDAPGKPDRQCGFEVSLRLSSSFRKPKE